MKRLLVFVIAVSFMFCGSAFSKETIKADWQGPVVKAEPVMPVVVVKAEPVKVAPVKIIEVAPVVKAEPVAPVKAKKIVKKKHHKKVNRHCRWVCDPIVKK